MSYENAPATTMLASHCACCARPLVDAQSVEIGIGPVCREKYMVVDTVTREARMEGNKLIHTIARLQRGREVILAISRLKELGFIRVVERIEKRLNKQARPIELSYQGGRIYLKTHHIGEDMFDAYLKALRSIYGRKWEVEERVNSFPMDQKRSVWEMVRKFFSGYKAIGPKGEFVI